MNNYFFEEFFNKEFNGDANAVLAKYTYDDGKRIKDRIKNSKNDKNEIKDILNSIVLRKINRMIDVDDSIIIELISLPNIESKEDAIGKDVDKVKSILFKLLNCKGIRLAMASTFLHFFNPKVFPIFDQRAYRVIYKMDYKNIGSNDNKVNLYINYLKDCINYYEEYLKDKIDFCVLDKYLYQLDKEIGNKII